MQENTSTGLVFTKVAGFQLKDSGIEYTIFTTVPLCTKIAMKTVAN